MADVDMTDAPASAPVTKKKGAATADGDKGDGKKRFEVKKVWHSLCECRSM
jgi:E3 ubiquitin-protein ligase RBX1